MLAACSSPRGTVDAGDPDADVLATIDGQPITVAELESQYLRTVSDTSQAIDDSMEEYRDFLDRYVDFRLKVAEAGRLGYGNLPELNAEL